MVNEIRDDPAVRNYYKDYLLNIKNLPSIPFVMMEVTKMLGSSRTSASDLGKVISQDQGLVAKILTVANSPLFGLPRRVATIEFAIVILGFDHIKNIVIALSMIEAFKNKDDKNWSRKKYWRHSILTAIAAKRIAEDLGYAKSGEAFTAGLLHDLGISVIQRYFNKEYNSICELIKEKDFNYLHAEEKILGISHSEIGKYLLEKWNLPKCLGDAVLNHHKPGVSENNKHLSAIVHISDYMTQKFSMGNIQWDDNCQLDLSIIDILSLGNEEYLQKFMGTYEPLYKNQNEIFSL